MRYRVLAGLKCTCDRNARLPPDTMPVNAPPNSLQLFRQWRSGDAEAGQAMAQRFADWYYAIAISRLGEQRGTEPCRASCQKFGDGIVQVADPKVLIPWAHKLLQDELAAAGDPATDGDEPGAYTGHQHPKELLATVRHSLPGQLAALEQCYHAKKPNAQPLKLLQARYEVKRWLKANAQIPFKVAPESPNPDRAPITHYESGLLEGTRSQLKFERWMLTDIDMCQDIAEFAPFAVALRGGLPPVSYATSTPPATPLPELTPSPSSPVATTKAHDVQAQPNEADAGAISGIMVVGLILAALALITAIWWMYV